MKKFIQVLMVAVLFAGMSTAAFAATSVLDQVGVSYDTSGTVVLLGLTGGDGVSLTYGGGTWGVAGDVAGAQPSLTGGTGAAAADGGYLKYTLYGVNAHKITVQTDTGTADTYAANSLSVKISAISGSGSVVASTLGTKVADYVTLGAEGPAAKTLISTIAGANTWTGTATADGARLNYQLNAAPLVTVIKVLYTIVAE